MLPSDTTTPHDRIVLAATTLVGLALVGAAAGVVDAAFLGDVFEDLFVERVAEALADKFGIARDVGEQLARKVFEYLF